MTPTAAAMSTRDAGTELTRLLRESSRGNRDALDRLLPIIYAELKSMAHNRLRAEREGHTLNTTALVHETYLKLVDQDRVEWRSRSHFFAVGAQAMRRILVDYARARNTDKRGGRSEHVSVDAVEEEAASALLSAEVAAGLVALDDALQALARFDARAAKVVECRFFAGLKHGEIAAILGISEPTVRRSWTTARAWLRRELGPDAPDFPGASAGPVETGGSS